MQASRGGTSQMMQQTLSLSRTTRCLVVLAGLVSVIIQIMMMASDSSWWTVCNTIPCWAESVPTGDATPCVMTPQKLRVVEENLRVPALANRSHECMQNNGECDYYDTCRHYKIYLYQNGLSMEETCLHQLRQGDGSWVSFGEMCCSICGGGYDGDMEYVFKYLATRHISCGVFNCKRNHVFSLCPPRQEHVTAAQAFMIIGVCFLIFTTMYHILELCAYDRDSRMPLPHALRTVKEWLRDYMHFGHWITGFVNFIAAILLVAALTRDLCDDRLVNYVEPSYGVRVMWLCMACQIFLGSMYYQQKVGWRLFALYVKSGHMRDRQAVRSQTNRSIDLGSEPTNGQNDVASPPAATSPPQQTTPAQPVELRAAGTRSSPQPAAEDPAVARHRMSPMEGTLDLDDDNDAQPAPLAIDSVNVRVDDGDADANPNPHPIRPPPARTEPRVAS